MTINNEFIFDAGFMGSGIAQVCSLAGIKVFLFDINQETVDKGLENIAWSIEKLIQKKIRDSSNGLSLKERKGWNE